MWETNGGSVKKVIELSYYLTVSAGLLRAVFHAAVIQTVNCGIGYLRLRIVRVFVRPSPLAAELS